jgi:AcrR family transcriptional regulator
MGHREALLDGARRCLLERGYARTTARDLVAASGTNLASIGYHFGSKEALLNEAMQQCFDEYVDQIDQIVFADPSATALQRVRASWEVLVSTFEQYRPLMVAFVEALAQAQRVPELRAQLADCYERLRATVADMVRASVDGLSEPTARQVASFLIAVYEGLKVQWLLDPQRAPSPDELMAALEIALPAALAAERVGSSSRATNPSLHGDCDGEQARSVGGDRRFTVAGSMQRPNGPVAGCSEEPELSGGRGHHLGGELPGAVE